jgi:hypothetical protein
MNIKPIIVVLIVINSISVSAQKYFTKTGYISFFSDAKLEKIEGHNKSTSCVIDITNGKIEWGVLIKGFQFEKALLQEHFNENYMESTKYPKALFKGKISGYDIYKKGSQTVKVQGDLTIHGVKKAITTDAIMTNGDGKIVCSAAFNVLLADYKISIPTVVKDQISKTVKIKIEATLLPFKS